MEISQEVLNRSILMHTIVLTRTPGAAGDWTDDGACSSLAVNVNEAAITHAAITPTIAHSADVAPKTEVHSAEPSEHASKNSRFFRF